MLKEKFTAAGQGHVFKYFDELDEAQKSALTAQLEQVDLDELATLNKELVFGQESSQSIDFSKLSLIFSRSISNSFFSVSSDNTLASSLVYLLFNANSSKLSLYSAQSKAV